MSVRIASFTDFGIGSPYLAQLEAAIYANADDIDVFHLLADAPCWRPRHASYLLSALVCTMPLPCHLVAVVDPGVGGHRRALAIKVDGYWVVGPDNGLLVSLVRRARRAVCYQIDWQPAALSSTFHGRDLFAPVIAKLATGQFVQCSPIDVAKLHGFDWPNELAEVIYVDAYGNLLSGLDASQVDVDRSCVVNGVSIRNTRTFSDVGIGNVFWFTNAFGLVEIAVNQGSAAHVLAAQLGTAVLF